MNIDSQHQSYPLGLLAMMERIRKELRRKDDLVLQQAAALGKL